MAWFFKSRKTERRPPSRPAVPFEEFDSDERLLDMQSLLRQASTRVSVDHLVQSGKRYIQVLSNEKLQELINRSVQTIVDKHLSQFTEVSEETAAQIAEESQAEFQELLSQYKEMSRTTREVERSRKALDEELEQLRKELEEERATASQHVLQVAPGPVGDTVPELNAQIDRLFEARRKLKDGRSPEAAEDLRQVEGVFRRMVESLLALPPEPPDGSLQKENSILQRRIEKLNEYVASLENALKTLSNAKQQSNQQIQNVLRQLGLAQEDKNFEKKKEALKLVLQTNQSVRRDAKALAAQGVSLSTPGGVLVKPPAAEPEPAPAPAPASTPAPAAPAPVAAPAPPKELPPIATATMEWSLDRSSA